MNETGSTKPGVRVGDSVASEIKAQLEKKLAGKLNREMESIVPFACRLIGEESPDIFCQKLAETTRTVFTLFETVDELRTATFTEFCKYFAHREPWEDHDILLFDESFEWFIGISHNERVTIAGNWNAFLSK